MNAARDGIEGMNAARDGIERYECCKRWNKKA